MTVTTNRVPKLATPLLQTCLI